MTIDTDLVLRILGQSLALLVVGALASLLVRRVLVRWVPPERVQLFGRAAFWGIVGLGAATILRELGFDLSVLLGAAGVLTVALGFASQTSASNVISGLFLIGERPFSVGDVVRIGTTTGEVVGIDLLSVKLRTMDNLFVRVPNESVMKAEITNITRFPIRRIDLQIDVAYGTDLEAAEKVFLAACAAQPAILDEPEPFAAFTGFMDSGIRFQVSAWTQNTGFMKSRTRLAGDVLKALDQAGIEVPFPHRVVISKPAPAAVPQAHADAEDEHQA